MFGMVPSNEGRTFGTLGYELVATGHDVREEAVRKLDAGHLLGDLGSLVLDESDSAFPVARSECTDLGQ
jgi:hypothetical protein